MVMDAGLHEPCALLPGSKRDGHMPIYPQIAATAANGFTAEELESLLFLSPDGIASAVGGSGYPISRLLLWFRSPAPTARRHYGMRLPPPSVGQRFKGVLGNHVGLHQPHVHG